MRVRRLVILAALAMFASAVFASDHADPAVLARKEAGLTDLFFFPNGDDYIVMMNVFPKLSANPPYKLEGLEYRINFDLHTQVTFDNAADKARYGGTVVNAEGIKADKSIVYTLKNDGTFNSVQLNGFTAQNEIERYAGIRDDPFIFPRFFGFNTVAAVFAIPKSQFANQQNFVIYGECWEDGKLVDTVGRSNRSQNGRFQFLTDVPVAKQKEKIQKEFNFGTKVFNFLQRETWTQGIGALYHESLQLYPYDLTNPDVMIFSTANPPGYPNGRFLTDDVAYISCQYGDCALMSLSYAESPQFPRATTNDKPFLPNFPFLAEPWPAKTPAKMSGLGCGGWLTIILVILFIGAIVWWVISRKKWHQQYPTVDPSKL
jgi:hypothetical protein